MKCELLKGKTVMYLIDMFMKHLEECNVGGRFKYKVIKTFTRVMSFIKKIDLMYLVVNSMHWFEVGVGEAGFKDWRDGG